MKPPKGMPSPSRGVEDGTPKSRRSYGRIDAPYLACHAREFPTTVRRSAQQVHRAEATVHRAVAVGVFDSRVLTTIPKAAIGMWSLLLR